jgi:hypothetical protein
MRLVISPLELLVGLVSVEVVAPVVLVDPLVAPIVLEVDVLGEVLDVALLGDVLLSVEAEREASVELVVPLRPLVLELSDVEALGEVLVELLELGLEVLPYVELVPGELVELGLVELVP